MSGDFVHLHLHSQFSLLDGANRLKDLVRHVQKNGMSAVAVTDHGNMYGVLPLYEAARDAAHLTLAEVCFTLCIRNTRLAIMDAIGRVHRARRILRRATGKRP